MGDKYGIRNAFRPAAGQVFIIADYAQLELCMLAEMANCASMINALKKGADFHSQVASEMFPHVRDALAQRRVAMREHDAQRLGVPTVKELFPVERKQSKAINFGIIYGMTPRSLGEDLGISTEDARDLMQKW